MKSEKLKKRLNWKRFIILTATLVVLGGSAYFLHAFQVNRNAHGLYEQSEVFKKSGEDKLAINSLQQYIGLMPEDDKALALLGTWLAEAAETPMEKLRAYLMLKQSLRRQDDQKIRRKTAKLGVELGLFDQAKKELEKLPKDAEVFELLAQVELGNREFQKADDYYVKAIELDPQREELYEQYAYVLRVDPKNKEENEKKADDQIKAMVKLGTWKSHVFAASYYRRFGDLDKAASHIKAATALDVPHKDEIDVLLLAGDIALAQGKTAEARDHFEKGLEREETNSQLIQSLARLELQDGNRETAAEHLKKALDNLPEELNQVFYLGNLLLDAGETKKLPIIVQRFEKESLTPFADYLQARRSVSEKKWGDATFQLNQIRSHYKLRIPLSRQVRLREQIETLLGDCHGRLSNPDEQIKAYRRALENGSDWTPAQRRLATALAATGDFPEAIKLYRKVVGQDSDQKIELARTLIKQNLRMPFADRNWKEAESILNSLSKEQQNTADVMMLRASMLAARGKVDEAKKKAMDASKADPESTTPWMFLIAVAEQQKAPPKEILDLINQADNATKSRKAQWILARAGYYLKNDRDNAKKHLQDLEKQGLQLSGEERDQVLSGLGQAFLFISERDEAKNLWTELAKRQPDDLSVRFRLLELALTVEGSRKDDSFIDVKDLQHWSNQIKELEGNGPITAYSQAAVHAMLFKKDEVKHKKSFAEALDLLKQASIIRPTWSRVPWLAGYVYELGKQRGNALKEYKKAIDSGDNRLAVHKRALELARKLGQFEVVNELLKNLPEVVKEGDEFFQFAVEAAMLAPDNKGARQEALQLAEQKIGKSENFLDHVWLGQMAMAAKSPAKAEAAFRQARTIAEQAYAKGKAKVEDVSAAWVISLMYLAETDKEKARNEIDAAKSAFKRMGIEGDKLHIVLAPCLEALGDLDKAEKEFEAALASNPSDPLLQRNVASFYSRKGEISKAEPLLRKLLQSKEEQAVSQHPWARQSLALALSKQGNYKKFNEALSLIEQNRKDGELSPADRIVKALVLSAHPAHYSEAIKILNELSVGELPAGSRFQLAKLYYAKKDWDQVETQMQLLLKDAGNNPVYLGFYINALLKDGQEFRASLEIDKLRKVSPDSYQTAALYARVLHANKKTEEAKQVLLAYAKKDKEAPLHVVARLLEELEFNNEAEKMLKDYVATSKDPNRSLVFARFLERQNRLDEALDICEKAWGVASPVSVGLASVEMVHQGKAKDAQVKRVMGWIKKAVAEHPDDQFLPILLADLYGYQGQEDEAVQIYQDVIAKNEKHVIALNNLAFLLAFQSGKEKAALATIDKAIKWAGPIGELLDTRAVILLRNNQANSAIRDLEDALIQGSDANRFFHLAQAYLMAGQRIKAEEALRRAVEEFELTVTALPTVEQPAFNDLVRQLKFKLK